MTTTMDWTDTVGRSWAALWAETDRSFSGLTQQLLDRLTAYPAARILDVGCGAGELSLALGRARPNVPIVGVDISPALIDAARERGINRPNVSFVLGDAAQWHDPDGAPDLIVSRHGVMFFEDPVAAFTAIRGGAAPGAKLLFSCFRSPSENPWATELPSMIRDGIVPAAGGDPYAPGPFAFADPAHVRAILEGAGWQDVAVDAADFAYIAGFGPDAVGDARRFFSRIGPAAAALRELREPERSAIAERMGEWLESRRSGDIVAFPAAAWIVTARA